MNSGHIELGVSGWCSLVPEAGGYLCSLSRDGVIERQQFDKPILDSIPAMQRRRLSPLARVVFHALTECLGEVRDEPVIFSSRLGEIQRTQNVLEAIAADEQVSPAAFSLAVHNGIAGLWSLVHGVRAPLLSLAPGGGSPVPALLEAAGHIYGDGLPAITVVCYDDTLPDFYRPFLEGPSAPVALALRLTAVDAARQSLVLQQRQDSPRANESDDSGVGFGALLALLQGRADTVLIGEVQCGWQLQLAA